MMHHVRGPEQPAFVAGAVKPVIGEVFSEKQNGPGPPLISDIENGEAMDSGICRERQRLAGRTKKYAPSTHDQAGGSVLELIEIAAHYRVKHHLKQQERDKPGNGQVNEIGNLRHVNQPDYRASVAESG